MRIPGAGVSAADAPRAYTGQTTAVKAAHRTGAARRFDSVTLRGDGTRGSFEMELRGKLSQEVRTATTSGQVAALREQVRSGSYRTDPREIARSMLLMEAV